MRKTFCARAGTAVFLIAGLCLAAAAQDTGAPAKDKREEYRVKSAEMDRQQLAARLELANWCIENNLLKEAQAQLAVAGAIDPKCEEVYSAWRKIIEKTPRKPMTLCVALADGDVIKGTCSLPPWLLSCKEGVVLVTLDRIRKVDLLSTPKPGQVVVALEMPEGKYEGTMTVPDFAVKSALGLFVVSFDKMRKFQVVDAKTPEVTVGGGAPAKTPDKPADPVPDGPGDKVDDKKGPGDADADWGTHLANMRKQGLEVVFVFDATGSMGGIILEMKTRIRQLVKTVTGLVPNARFGLVAYRDQKKYDLDDYEWVVKFIPLTKGDPQGVAQLEAFLRATEAYGGGDIPEAVYEGVQTAIQKGGWSAGGTKIIIVFGDAPPHKENNGLPRLYAMARDWHAKTGGIVCCIDTTGGSRVLGELADLAKAGAGEATFLNDERALIRQLSIYIFGTKWQGEIDKAWGAPGR
jgi:hypothetical protein